MTSTPTSSRSILRRLAWLLATVLVAGAFLAACSDEAQEEINERIENSGGGSGGEESGGGGEESGGEESGGGGEESGGGGEESGGEAPAPTAEPAPTPEQTDGTEEGLTGQDWLIIALLGVAVVAVIIFAA
ncbi:MAG: hypothetical protein ACR2NL_06350, partial [Acidimicrobiia bacterium]